LKRSKIFKPETYLTSFNTKAPIDCENYVPTTPLSHPIGQ